VRAGGALRRENVGMSNHKSDEKSDSRKSKVSSAMEISGGLGGPKAMAKAAADGQLVNIPVRPLDIDEVTKKIKESALLVWHYWCLGWSDKQICRTEFNFNIRTSAKD